jgi:SynChlorMet cassette protein ScmD
MLENARPMANSSVVLREEFDDWAILFDPDANVAFGINPMGVHVWKYLDGRHTLSEILSEIRADCDDVPDDAETHVRDFIDELLKKGLARQ